MGNVLNHRATPAGASTAPMTPPKRLLPYLWSSSRMMRSPSSLAKRWNDSGAEPVQLASTQALRRSSRRRRSLPPSLPWMLLSRSAPVKTFSSTTWTKPACAAPAGCATLPLRGRRSCGTQAVRRSSARVALTDPLVCRP